jgi:hypothetical protein
MNRRRATRALLAAPFAFGAVSRAFAQQSDRVYRIGYLSQPTRASVEKGLGAFLKRLRDLGWIEGKNLVIEYRWAEGNAEKLPELAADLCAEQRRPDRRTRRFRRARGEERHEPHSDRDDVRRRSGRAGPHRHPEPTRRQRDRHDR